MKKLPYSFRGVTNELLKKYQQGKLVEREKAKQYFGEGVHQQFSRIYSNVLSAIADNDQEYLKQIMEKRLYQKTIEGIEQMQKKKVKINYLEDPRTNFEEIIQNEEEQEAEDIDSKKQTDQNKAQQSEIDVSQYKEIDMKILLEAYGVFGAHINRNDNKGKAFEIKGAFSERSYFIDLFNLPSLYNHQILCLNVFFETTRRLYITDEFGDLIQGEDNLIKEVNHVWRFETYSPNYDWVLTDMDYILERNPYFKKIQNKQQTHNNQNDN